LFKETYHLINFLFAGIIALIMLYSGIFSAEGSYPVPSACVYKPCPSTGLSRSFSEMIRFRVHSAASFNENGPRIFLFFAAEFFLRFIFSFLYCRYRKSSIIIFTDIFIFISLFIFSFQNFIILLF